MSRKLAEDGWRFAVNRLKAEGTAGGLYVPDDRNVTIGEMLFWLSVVEDDEERPDKVSYHARRANSVDGRIVGALVFARNGVAHQLIEPTEVITHPGVGMYGTGMYGTVMYGGNPPWVSWHWRRRSELGLGDTKFGWGRDTAYDSLVSGQPTLVPLSAAAQFFGLASP